MAKLTLIGMHNYTDAEIWDGLTFPTGFNKDIFIDTVLLHYGELETLYADPDMMQYAITAWGRRNQWGINKAITAINISYEPLQNYDRHETRTGEMSEAGTHSLTGNGTTNGTSSYGRDISENTTTHSEGETSGSSSGTTSGTTSGTKNTTTSAESDTTTTTSRTESGQAEHTVSAYDSSSYAADNKDVTSGSLNETVTASSDSSGTGSETTSGTTSGTTSETTGGTTETDGTESKQTLIDDNSETSGTTTSTEQGSTSTDREESETIRAWGNIGVTTSQQMLQSELDLTLYNIYDTFAGIFACDLLLMIY